MKKAFAVAILCIIFVSGVFAIDVDSDEMLKQFYIEEKISDSSEFDYWNSTKVSLLTFYKGDEIFSWFGHSAILFEHPDGSYMYDYGNFSMGNGFLLNFAYGKLWYWCEGQPSFDALYSYQISKRSVSQIMLEISPEKKKALEKLLVINSSEEYRLFSYNNFSDNCATRVRDVINVLTENDFKEWADSKIGTTKRQEESRIMHNNVLFQWLFNLVEGQEVDKPISVWDDMYLPENLQKYVLEYGKLGTKCSYLFDFTETDNRKKNFDSPQSELVESVIVGLILAFVVFIARKKNLQGLYKGFTFSIDLIIGILGLVLCFMSFISLHDYCYNNENIFFINPLALVCAVLAFSKKKNCIKVRCIIHWILTALLLLLIILKVILPGIFFQANWAQILTFLPYYLFVAVCCKRDYNNT